MLISDHDDLFFLYNFRPVQDYFSSYETGKSVTGGKGENPEKTNLHTQKQNLVYVTRDCKTDQLGNNLRRRVHCLGVGSCQNDIVALKVVLIHFIRCCVMSCDVASIFVVRTLIVSQAYTMVLTLIDNTRIHIFIYMYSINVSNRKSCHVYM